MLSLVGKYIYHVLGIAVLSAGLWFYFENSGETKLETITVTRGDIEHNISVSGKVKAAESVDLGFDKSGRISRVSAKVGDRVSIGQTLVEIYNADLISDLREAEANLKLEIAQLEDIKNGAREEDINVAEAKVDDARQNLIDYIEDSYTKADDAISNKVDQFFSNPKSSNPQVNLNLFGQLEFDLENGRLAVGNEFKSWNELLLKMDSEANLYVFSGETLESLKFIKSYLDVVAIAAGSLEPTTSLTQAKIDSYRADISTARTNINTAINNVSSATTALKITESELVKAQAGSTREKILIQEASVEKARANVANIQAQISKTRITSPLKGIVTKQDAKVGQIVSASLAVVSVISDASYQIEANLSESDIAKVSVGNLAILTLDAYGDDSFFDARVISIDPAETIIEGISTYKVTLEFVKEDSRIKSGLTAEITIMSERRQNVLSVSQRAIISQDGGKFVRVQRADGRVDEVKVELGLVGSNGKVEVLSGLEEGMTVVISSETK